jgi:hypothetical protein
MGLCSFTGCQNDRTTLLLIITFAVAAYKEPSFFAFQEVKLWNLRPTSLVRRNNQQFSILPDQYGRASLSESDLVLTKK